MNRLMCVTLTAVFGCGLVGAAVAQDGPALDLNSAAAVEAYRVRDPEVLQLAQRLLNTADTDVKGFQLPNPHPDAQWFPEAGLGLFMHWGIHSVVGAQPSWAMIKDYKYAGSVKLYPPEKYFALADRFDPQKYHPEKWLATAKAAGFNYAVLTTKHHDGYALWPTRFGNFSTRQYLGGRDLLKPYVTACRQHGLKVGFYFSPRDWHFPNYPVGDVDFDNNKRGQYHPVDPEINQRRFEQFFAYTIGQLHELLTQYGKIDVLWFDGMGWHGIGDMHTKAVYQWIRTLQPGIVINERWSRVRNPDSANEARGFGDFVTVECRTAEERPAGWWETCTIWDMGGGWGYDTSERVRDLEWSLQNLVHCRKWGGNLLLNVGPRPDGEMTRGFYDGCQELQDWMATYRDAVIGTQPPTVADPANVAVTTRPGIWYLHVPPKWNRNEPIVARVADKIDGVYLLRDHTALRYSTASSVCSIEPPAGNDREVIVLKLATAPVK